MKAIKKYGKENFTKECLYIFDDEDLMNLYEKAVVDYDNPMSYNLKEGGQGGFDHINREGNHYKFTREDSLRGVEVRKRLAEEDLDYYRKTAAMLKPESRVKMLKGLIEYYQKARATGKNLYSHKNLSEDKLNEINEKRKSTFKDMGHSQGQKNSQYGTMWITNGVENKKIKKDIDIIPDGWYKGRKI